MAEKRGGKRKGAGRPSLPDDKKITYKTLGVRLSPEFFEKLDNLARSKGISKSEIAREAIEIFIEKYI